MGGVMYLLDTMVHRTRALNNSTLLSDARGQLFVSYMYRTHDMRLADHVVGATPMYKHNRGQLKFFKVGMRGLRD